MPQEEAVEVRRSAPPDDPSLIDISDLASALGADLERGLGSDEATQRLQTDGPNELRAVPPVPAWRRVLAQLQDPQVYLPGAAAAIALAAWWFGGRGHPGAAGWPLDAIVIACVVVLNAVLGWLQEAVVHLPFLNLAFGTAPLSAAQWYVCVMMASGVLWFSEVRKLLRRRSTRRVTAPPMPGRTESS